VTFLKSNPIWTMASVQAIVAAGLNLYILFVATITAAQTAAINLFVGVVLAFVMGLISQSTVQAMIDREVDTVLAAYMRDLVD
jgi:hypothetical protein